ncbi:uncharacterized protein LOC130901716 [Diorhabda carinulata]|uniref:uncharacterized protein LOC130901716 n=1 Tax=Diorhabda carinulata TaxID=1163345 RepID=UPI0025A2EA4A|nr:uncharacterized protein LOC130901716 [Diorhabda carinulata]XP_057669249.1 uncharacterized protein LOC130901716 [Diorhabda carinulata]
MVQCWAPGCKHYNVRERCKFYRFPKDPKVRSKWIKLTRRTTEPGPGAFLCSCHFVDGKEENGPTIFLHNEGKMFNDQYPQKKKRPLQDGLELQIEPQASTSKETDDFSQSNHVMTEAENYFLQQSLEKATGSLSHLSETFSFDHIRSDNNLVILYTGLPTTDVFMALYHLLEKNEIRYYFKWKVEKMRKIDQLLMTLMKLKQNFPHQDLAVRFNVSQGTVSNVVTTWVHALHEILFKQFMSEIPDRSKNQLCLLNCFSSFTNCRIIIDCTEVYTCINRQSMSSQKLTYSSYKHRNTCKGLVGVAPNGVATFLSCLYPGSTSDKKIVKDCGILNQLKPGDLVLADKGFLIKDLMLPGVHINIPPFLTTPQFTTEQVHQTECIARARIHVERAIRRMKVFNILNLIPHSLLPHADAVFQVVGALTNLQYPLIKEVG